MTVLRARIFFLLLICLVPFAVLTAQEQKGDPEWWFGIAPGVNFNYYGGEVHQLNASTLSLQPFTKGAGKGFYFAGLAEYHFDPVWGAILHLGYDSRSGSFDDVSAGASTASLSTSLSYITIEPSLRLAPFSSSLYFFAGPRIAFNVGKSFTYSETGSPDVAGEWSATRSAVFGVQGGLGLDLSLTGQGASTPIKLSPFVAFHFGQGPRTEETWSLSTVRFGLALKFGNLGIGGGQEGAGEVPFSVKAPKVLPNERKVNETFPMRNFVFFDPGSTSVPDRYVTMTKEQADKFKEDQLLNPQPNDLTGRSRRQMTAYHNILNVLGDRMRRNPAAKITLTGSSESGPADGKALAESVKRYLVEIFGVEPGRITTTGREKPEVPSVQPGGTHELDLVRPEDRRVDISGTPVDILEPLQIVSLQEDPLDSDVLLSLGPETGNLASWNVEVTDEAGAVQHFGPFTGNEERIPGRAIIGNKKSGTYTVALVGQTKSGGAVRREQQIKLMKSDTPDEPPGLRFSILFEFDQSKTVATYERFLSGTVAPLIPDGASVVIHGHTDIVGEESHNLKLSRDRAAETQRVLERTLANRGVKGIKFDTYGFGEDIRRAPFDNKLPEERFYNRTVIIDIVPE
jgi:outer membrane protein OmpA-like peptidoglycan-associated protein